MRAGVGPARRRLWLLALLALLTLLSTTLVPIVAARTARAADPAQHDAGDGFVDDYFAAARTVGPSPPASGSSDGNGVYSYAPAGAFPDSTFSATNYWVDVVFSRRCRPSSHVNGRGPALKHIASSDRGAARGRVVGLLALLATLLLVSGLLAPGLPTLDASGSDEPFTTEAPPPAGTGAPAMPGSRSKYNWPFSATSIWNMPVGSSAVYLPLGLTPPVQGYGTDEVYLTFSPTAPLRTLVDRGYWWPWRGGTSVPGTNTRVSVRVPDNWIISPPDSSGYPNRSSAALQSDGTVREWQYTVRPATGSNISMFEAPRANYSLTGDGTQGNQFGAHGGSGMIGVGGTIRKGELTGPDPIRHALAVTMNMRKWGTKQGGNITDGFRWPATASDSYYDGSGAATGYGTISSGSPKNGLGMGSLLAIPASVDLNSLAFETTAGAKIAWTHQNYGAYVVDDSTDAGSFDLHRLNVEIDVLDEFPAIDTYPGTNTPFGRDMNKIFTRLAVVDNNGPSTIGGGGTPRQLLAPSLAS